MPEIISRYFSKNFLQLFFISLMPFTQMVKNYFFDLSTATKITYRK